MAVLDQSKAINRYFEKITSIPHGSRNESKLSDYLESFAKDHGFSYFRDPLGSVVIYKPASPGYEYHPTVMLQAHIDMVCEKNKDRDFNFDTDPLDIYLEDGWLKAKGTTLGADDGTGVSYMLAILEDPSLKHPPLECVFTVQEEIGLLGAAALPPELFSAKKMIGLDGGREGQTCVSSSGGKNVVLKRPVSLIDTALPAYKLSIGGLQGGHSGGMIDKERGNSIKIAFRVLNTLLRDGISFQIAEITGGLKSNAIPRECSVVFVSESALEEMRRSVSKVSDDVKEELIFSDKNVTITLEKTENPGKAFCPKCTKAIVKLGYLVPNGLKARSMEIEGLPTVSLNFGIIQTEGDLVIMTFSIRSPMVSAQNELAMQLRELAELFGAEFQAAEGYAGWNFQKDSPLREVFRECLKERGIDLVERATHGGLETGVFKGKLPDLDIITYGPDSSGAHTPDEKLNIASFERCYYDLVRLLERL